MAKKELLEITPEGLNLLTALCHSGYFEGFYGKSVYFTNGFEGDRQYLFQALGNMGAITTRSVDDVIDIIVIGENVMDGETVQHKDFAEQFNYLLNTKNSAHRMIRYISEEHLIMRLKNRGKDDPAVRQFLKKYNASIKTGQKDLFDMIDEEKNKSELV